jgi:Protein of unknown function (DUF1569)
MSTYSFIDTDLETLLSYFDKLSSETQPAWGSMSAQRMVEHLTDSLRIATGKNPQELAIPEDRIAKMVLFLDSDKPMAQNIEVPFATKAMELRHEELELAIDEFVDEYLEFMETFESTPELKTQHPYYGPLNYEQWQRLNQKHLSHHFHQFGLI